MPPSKRSGNPAKRQTEPEDKYAPTVWLSGGVGSMDDLELPSGQRVLARRPGVQGLIKEGILKNLDVLTNLVNEEHIKRVEGGDGTELNAMMQDPEKIAEITHVLDRVACACIIKPVVQPTPDDVTRRVQGVVYADMVDLMDKVFVFQYVVGGTRDLESFRGQLGELLGGVEDESDVQVSAK